MWDRYFSRVVDRQALKNRMLKGQELKQDILDELYYQPPPDDPVLLLYEDIFKSTFVKGMTISEFFQDYLQ